MNAVIQVLFNTPKFADYFLQKYKYEKKTMSNEMSLILKILSDDIGEKIFHSPVEFKRVLGNEDKSFAGFQANDPKDLIIYLLDKFHKENNDPPKLNNQNYNFLNNVNQYNSAEVFQDFYLRIYSQNKSIISELFYGMNQRTTTCTKCNSILYDYEIFSFLLFDLKQIKDFILKKNQGNSLEKKDEIFSEINLNDCFDFEQRIKQDDSAQFYCNICKCNMIQNEVKKIYHLPKYLIIILYRKKGDTYDFKVNFPENLNLNNYVAIDPQPMELYAVICHFGQNDFSGHFAAYCKHRKTQEWYYYKDVEVTKCNEKNPYYDGIPYILFYRTVEQEFN